MQSAASLDLFWREERVKHYISTPWYPSRILADRLGAALLLGDGHVQSRVDANLPVQNKGSRRQSEGTQATNRRITAARCKSAGGSTSHPVSRLLVWWLRKLFNLGFISHYLYFIIINKAMKLFWKKDKTFYSCMLQKDPTMVRMKKMSHESNNQVLHISIERNPYLKNYVQLGPLRWHKTALILVIYQVPGIVCSQNLL